MKCTNCGTECASEARFCGNCGYPLGGAAAPSPSPAPAALAPTVVYPAPTGAPVQPAMPDSARQYARYSQALSDMSIEVNDAKQAAYLADQDYLRYKSSLRNCLIAGVVIAICLGGGIFQFMSSNAASSGTEMSSIIIATVIFTIAGFFMPFGFTPMKNFIRDHGFFVVFSAMFLVMAAALAYMFSIIAGPIYLIYLLCVIPDKKRTAAKLHAHADEMMAAYQAM